MSFPNTNSLVPTASAVGTVVSAGVGLAAYHYPKKAMVQPVAEACEYILTDNVKSVVNGVEKVNKYFPANPAAPVVAAVSAAKDFCDTAVDLEEVTKTAAVAMAVLMFCFAGTYLMSKVWVPKRIQSSSQLVIGGAGAAAVGYGAYSISQSAFVQTSATTCKVVNAIASALSKAQGILPALAPVADKAGELVEAGGKFCNLSGVAKDYSPYIAAVCGVAAVALITLGIVKFVTKERST